MERQEGKAGGRGQGPGGENSLPQHTWPLTCHGSLYSLIAALTEPAGISPRSGDSISIQAACSNPKSSRSSPAPLIVMAGLPVASDSSPVKADGGVATQVVTLVVV